MSGKGYYRFPAVYKDTVVFVSEDDLWTVSAGGGVARRLTTNLGWAGQAFFSPDGEWLAFTGVEDGVSEVYKMPSKGGPLQRLTHLGTMTNVLGWTKDGAKILFRSAHGAHSPAAQSIFSVPARGGLPQNLGFGIAGQVAYGPGGAVVLGRWTGDPARWKRYRGGRAGILLVDAKGDGNFRPLIELEGNMASPMWIGKRVFFISDHEGVGNIYSCTPSGADLKRHTGHDDFYARLASTDGETIVYCAGGDLYILDPEADNSRMINVSIDSPRTRASGKFVDAAAWLDEYDLHPEGHSMVLTSRGKVFNFANWEGPVRQTGERQGVRYRFPTWLEGGLSYAVFSDKGGRDRLELHYADSAGTPKHITSCVDFGRPMAVAASPAGKKLAFTNNRNELWMVDLAKNKTRVLDKSDYYRVFGFDWSPDGKWICYSIALGPGRTVIRVASTDKGKVHDVSKCEFINHNPVFDVGGKYIYFLSSRSLDPVFDPVSFDYNFPLGVRPFAIVLAKDCPSPFDPVPHAPGAPFPAEDKGQSDRKQKDAKSRKKGKSRPPRVKIDFDGIDDRIIAFPVGDGDYFGLRSLPGGKVLYGLRALEGRLSRQWFSTVPAAGGSLVMYDIREGKKETLASGISSFTVSADRKTLAYRAGSKLRVIKAGEKADENSARDRPSRKSGWIDLSRIKLYVQPAAEWKQMFEEAWRLQLEYFWTPDMSKVDWEGVYRQYKPLLDRVASRGEFSDLVWEMQGELGTSHAYEFGGDYKRPPRYPVGRLCADVAWDKSARAYRITGIVRGDSWKPGAHSPLAAPALDIKEGDFITAVNGVRLTETLTPDSQLVNYGGTEVTITVRPAGGKGKGKERELTIKTSSTERPARYRAWVEKNRAYVYRATGGRCGYIHVPDCGALGYSEFHRSFIHEQGKDGLIVDIRFNGGGHVSSLLLEKLARKRIAYCKPRWGKPSPSPHAAPAGPMVALTNEAAGSDGDIFSHCFKLMGLGPLIGKRTWGGVIGICASEYLADHSLTTQPQFSYWFTDVGWGVENFGTVPDIEVDVSPNDYRAGRDPQLERAVKEIKRIWKQAPPAKPDFRNRPNLARPVIKKKQGKRSKAKK